MAKVHIALVGGQPTPVFQGIRNARPQLVVYVYSKQTEGLMGRIAREFVGLPMEKVEMDPVNVQSIEQQVLACVEKYKQDEVSINISGGTKPWAILFTRHFPNADLFYIDQNSILTHVNSLETVEVPYDIDIDFRLHGNELQHFTSLLDYTEDDKKALSIIESARRFNTGQFNKLVTILDKNKEQQLKSQKVGTFELSDSVSVSWNKDKCKCILNLSQASAGNKSFEIQSPHAIPMLFHSGWFEYKIARMISHWNRSVDIRMNCIFPPVFYRLPDSSTALQYPKNEIDIIINTGKKTLFVECKTMINNSTDIDKFRTAVKNYGGLGSKALFITDNNMTPLQKEKCFESGIISFSLKDELHGPNVEQELFKLLNTHLMSINDR